MVQIVVYQVVKSGAKAVVNTANINRLDKDIYINLFNIYKKRLVEERNFIKVFSECRRNENYQKLSEESQNALFYALSEI